MATGALTPVMRTGPEFDKMNAGYLAVHPNGRFLYATNEVESYDGEYGGGAVADLHHQSVDGSIAHVGTQPSMGVWPAYISIDKTGSRVAVANHGNYDPSVRIVKKNGVPEIEKVWDDGTVALLPVKARTAPRPSVGRRHPRENDRAWTRSRSEVRTRTRSTGIRASGWSSPATRGAIASTPTAWQTVHTRSPTERC